MFRALSHRNFRLFAAGAFLSNAGTWMQTVAQSWLVLQLTDSGTWLGVDNFVALAPGLLLTLVGGVIADKVDRKRLLIYTQAGAGASALVLALLVWTNTIHWGGEGRRPSDVWMVLVLSFVTGSCWAIAGPSYQAITVELVDREDFANAIALNSSQFQLARVAGPTLAALTMRLLGMAGCFFANGLSYVAIVAALARVRYEKRGAAAPPGAAGGGKVVVVRRSMWHDLAEGFRYVRGRPRVGTLLLCSAVVCLFGSPYLVLLPMFARNVYGWGESGLSLLMATAGAGALVGALALAYRGDVPRKGLVLLSCMLSGGACIVGLGAAESPAAAIPLLFGTLPVGSFLSGAAADRFGPRPALAACGLVVLLFGLTAGLVNPRLREM